jgi:hypothetical protein
MEMTFLRSNEGETRRDRIRNEVCRELGIQNLLIMLEEKRLRMVGHVKRMAEKGVRIKL